MLKPEKLIEDYVFGIKLCEVVERRMSFKDRIDFSLSNLRSILKKVWLYIVTAIGIGGFIHGYVPQDIVKSIMKHTGFFSVSFAVLICIPLYSNSAGVLVSMDIALAFMMAVTALSFPEFVILKQVMKPKLIAIFAVTAGISIIMARYLFNLLF